MDIQNLPQVIIVELGSQFTIQIQRTLRELGVRSKIIKPEEAINLVQDSVKAIILSGGSASVHDSKAPQLPDIFLSLLRDEKNKVPVLGICYGMQLLAHGLGGTVKEETKEYGSTLLTLNSEEESKSIFTSTSSEQTVWMNHGDSVTELPQGFHILAKTANAVAAMSNGTIHAVQFHPEATQTEYGKQIFQNFLDLAGCEVDWKPGSVIDDIQQKVLTDLGERKAIIGFSGGVDSTTLSAILAPVLGDKLIAITIDPGNLREGELDEIRTNAESAGINLTVVEAADEFIAALATTTDAEEKRARFKECYQKIFVNEAQKADVQMIIQGTLAADKIESGATGGAMIKSHHNVGLDMGGLEQIHPIDHLYKYEVRGLGKEIGLPERIFNRQPFPGPGLFIRIVDTPVTKEKLEAVRWADARVREILVKHGVYNEISQLVVAYMGIKTVGQKGDGRVYSNAIVVRPVTTVDFMTTEAYFLPPEIAKEISSVIPTHKDIVRVWFDYTEKPPATTEME